MDIQNDENEKSPSKNNSKSEILKQEARERILGLFENWLDNVLEEEDLPPGISPDILLKSKIDDDPDTEDRTGNIKDSYALWSAMTSLTQEIKLQGRAFGKLNETLTPLPAINSSIVSILLAHNEALAESRRIAFEVKRGRDELAKHIRRETEKRVRHDSSKLLLDIRDRLVRGLATTQSYNFAGNDSGGIKWHKRIFKIGLKSKNRFRDTARALEKGYILSLKHLDDELKLLDVYEIESRGQLFDSTWMKAVDIDWTSDVPEGSIVEVFKPGYIWLGEVFRTAEVKVARHSTEN